MTHPLPGHVQQLTTQVARLDAFSHVVECIFLLQQDNVLHQTLLDLWGDSGNPHAQYTHSKWFPLTPLPLPMAEPQMHNPSLMYTRIGLHSSKTCMTIATAKLSGLITTSLNLPHPILMAIACPLHIIMDGHPLCSH
jgi:hypothetical protein